MNRPRTARAKGVNQAWTNRRTGTADWKGTLGGERCHSKEVGVGMYLAKRKGYLAIAGGLFLGGGISLVRSNQLIIAVVLLVPGFIAYGFLIAWHLKRPH